VHLDISENLLQLKFIDFLKTKIMFTEKNAQDALLNFAKKDKIRAQLLERMMRLETAHFKSKQYLLTGSAGMEDGKWNLKKYLPNGYTTVTMNDNHPAERGQTIVHFIVWDKVENFLNFLNDYINRNNGNFARWNSLNLERQEKYRLTVNSIKNRFIV